MPSQLKNKITDAIKTIFDPEIPINIYELGLIYDITEKDGDVKILMTLTAPNRPEAEHLPQAVKEAVSEIDGVKNVIIELTFEPAWSEDKMSDAAKVALDMLY
jgi:FeS assembly SUF system protein